MIVQIIEYGEWLINEIMKCYALERGEAIARLDESYAGKFSSWEEWAKDSINKYGLLARTPEELREYIDYKKYGSNEEERGNVERFGDHFIYAYESNE